MKLCMKNCFNILVIITGLLLASQFVFALTFVGEDENNFMLFSSDKHLVKINPSENRMLVNNLMPIFPFPYMRVLNSEIEMPEPRFDKPVVGSDISNFKVTYPEAFAEDVYANVQVTITDKDVIQEIKLENTKETDVIVEVKITDENNPYSMYAPFAKDQSKHFAYLSPTDRGLYGNMLIIYFEPYPPSYPLPDVNVTMQPSKVFIWAVKIPAKSTYTLEFHYLGAYFAESTILNAFPVKSVVDKEVFLLSEKDPLLNEENKYASSTFVPSIDLTSGSSEIYATIVDYVNDLPSGSPDFPLTTNVDWLVMSNKSSYDSLEKALIFRESARRVGIPARLIIGKQRGGNYYAWVETNLGELTREYDPFNLKTEYDVIYKEPDPYFCKDEIGNCAFESAVKVGIVCIGKFCINVIWLIVVVVLLTIIGFFGITYKSNLIARLMAEKPTKRLVVDGTYHITRPDFSTEDPLLMDVFEYIKSRGGVMNVDNASVTLGYSKVLVKAAVEKLVEIGVITKT